MKYLVSMGVPFGENGITHSTARHRRNYWCTENKRCKKLLNDYRNTYVKQEQRMEKYRGYRIEKTENGFRVTLDDASDSCKGMR